MDGAMTKASLRRKRAGGKLTSDRGTKRSPLTDTQGMPVAEANCHDSKLVREILENVDSAAALTHLAG